MTTVSSPRTLTIGYLQVGPLEHGICRYGRLLAAAARRDGRVAMVERNVVLSGRRWRDRAQLRSVALDFAAVDLVHLQVSVWSRGTWGRTWHALANLRRFRRQCRAPLVVTLHDVNSLAALACRRPMSLIGSALAEPFKAMLRPGGRLVKHLRYGSFVPAHLFRELWRFEPEYPWLVAREVLRGAAMVFVLTTSEKAALRAKGIRERVVRIPHFVEDLPTPPAAAASSMGSDRRTVILAGFMFGSKGHDLVVETMPLIPEVKVVFLGGPSVGSPPAYRDRLLELARRHGVQDRLEVTGYLPDLEYLDRIYKADLAICPFAADKSASGSLATLIAAGCPVLASNIPPIAEFNALVPGAIRTFQPYTPEALASAVRAVLATPRASLTGALAELRARLSLSAVYDQHVREYRRVLGLEGATETG